MKQFIVLAAVLPILMIFVMQTGYDQKSNRAINMIHDMVYVATEQAKEEGSFTWEIQEILRRNVSNALEISPDDISLIFREENGLLFYRVEVPIRDVMAGSRLLGISDRDNQYTYVIDSYTKARKIPDVGDDEEDVDELKLIIK